RRLCEGDLLMLDLVAVKDGVVADSAISVRVGNVSPIADALVRCAEAAFWQAMKSIATRLSNLSYRSSHRKRSSPPRFQHNARPWRPWCRPDNPRGTISPQLLRPNLQNEALRRAGYSR